MDDGLTPPRHGRTHPGLARAGARHHEKDARVSSNHISAVEHARRSWLLAALRLRRSLAFGSGRRPPWTPSSKLDSVHSGSFSLRSGAHVLKYCPWEAPTVAWSSRKPRQNPSLQGGRLKRWTCAADEGED